MVPCILCYIVFANIYHSLLLLPIPLSSTSPSLSLSLILYYHSLSPYITMSVIIFHLVVDFINVNRFFVFASGHFHMDRSPDDANMMRLSHGFGEIDTRLDWNRSVLGSIISDSCFITRLHRYSDVISTTHTHWDPKALVCSQ